MTEDSDRILSMTAQMLTDLEHAETYAAALKLSQEIYNVARVKLPEDEIIKAIERRLPQPHREYADAASVRMNQGQLIITRPIGELEGRVIYVTPTPDGAYFGSVKVNGSTGIPAWDTASPKFRRNRSTA